MKSRVTVLLVDDHPVVREGYRRLLEESNKVAVLGEAADAEQACDQFARLQPHVVVMDLALPGVSGIEAIRRIHSHNVEARVLVFSMHEDAIFVRRSLDAGATGYVTKASAPAALVTAVEAVASGKRYLSHDVAQTLALESTTAQLATRLDLSSREFGILELLLQGYSIPEIGHLLHLHPKTIANHQSLIKQKLGADSTAQLFRQAMRFGLLPRP